MIQTNANAEAIKIINLGVEELLEKGAKEPVPFVERHSGFYRTMFLVPKTSGELRPVINLRPLNQF